MKGNDVSHPTDDPSATQPRPQVSREPDIQDQWGSYYRLRGSQCCQHYYRYCYGHPVLPVLILLMPQNLSDLPSEKPLQSKSLATLKTLGRSLVNPLPLFC